jgi:hypothetical protein
MNINNTFKSTKWNKSLNTSKVINSFNTTKGNKFYNVIRGKKRRDRGAHSTYNNNGPGLCEFTKKYPIINS